MLGKGSHNAESQVSLCGSIDSQDPKVEITAASVVCGTCRMKCGLSCRTCPVCEAAPRLNLGGYSFLGEKKALYDASTGPDLANSIVFLARAKSPTASGRSKGGEEDEMQIAMKLVPLDGDPSSVEMARREIQVFQTLGSSRHPNLLPLLFGAETETELVLLTPYAPSGDLDSLTRIAGGVYKCLEECEAAALASQLLAGLASLHSLRYVHGDFKPHNIFLTEIDGALVAQIGDFGLTRRVSRNAEGVECVGGTSGFMAPELVGRESSGSGPQPIETYAADLFALGVTLYQLLSSMSPFDPPSNVRAPLEFDEACWGPLLPSSREFVATLLARDPKARSTAADLARHPWLAAAADVPKGAPRQKFAPHPEPGLRFHTAARVQELSTFVLHVDD
uniref:Protein kinase domain-containing protein n=1 Tax=Alexandrium catenella TaxID=2925 RepID=A0A7S1PZZ4_ALECA|mmetsp:Transcript_11896/g.32542  ORF Transcript_11896/g.32542 Transcript_11896/m.32542 type:complete len:393 (+) Transcript_11896:168-1346(+)